LLDIALESWLRLLIERQDKRSLSGDDLVELMGLVLGNAALTVSVSRMLYVTDWVWIHCYVRDRLVELMGLVLGNAALAVSAPNLW
jgi:hypothetical protein